MPVNYTDNIVGQVTVTYRSDHKGHQCDFAHLPLPRRHHLQIAGMLAAGLPMDDVIDQVQSKDTKLTSLHFLTKCDLKNIMRDFNINKGRNMLYDGVLKSCINYCCKYI